MPEQPPETPESGRPSGTQPLPWWRRKEIVEKIGYILSAIWMGAIVVITKGDIKHYLFNFIFTVPLIGWVIGLGIAALLRRSEKHRKNP